MPRRKNPVRLITQKLDAGKADDIRVYDRRAVGGFADTMIVATGTSTRHVLSLAYHLQEALKENGIRADAEGLNGAGHWVIVDIGNVLVHIMTQEARTLYALDALWQSAPPNRTRRTR